MGEHIDQYQNIARLFRRLADAFDALGGGGPISRIDFSNAPDVNFCDDFVISGVVMKDAECKAFQKRNGDVGYMTRINVKMPKPINNSFFANCIAWTNKPEYQFKKDDAVEFRGHFELNSRGYVDFIVAKDGNLKPKAPAPSAEDTQAEDEIPF